MNRVRLSCCCCSCCCPLAFFSVVFLVAKKDLRLFVRLFHAGERLAYANARLPQPHAPIHARLFKLPYRGSSSKVASLTVRRSVSLPFSRHFVSTEYRANFCQTSVEPQNACSCRNCRRSTSWNANVSQSTFRSVTSSLRKLESENHNGELSRSKYWSIVIETRRLIELKLVCRSVVRSTRLFQSSPILNTWSPTITPVSSARAVAGIEIFQMPRVRRRSYRFVIASAPYESPYMDIWMHKKNIS